ncbi:hypothetical protein [Absidia glauca]|uniref:Uncharacterized protein n=1 Tax=Absidia glauca TaxID=4829 RepID=A0A168QEW6_ABSGL|nr:hypothetical protein [Absidia glauca]
MSEHGFCWHIPPCILVYEPSVEEEYCHVHAPPCHLKKNTAMNMIQSSTLSSEEEHCHEHDTKFLPAIPCHLKKKKNAAMNMIQSNQWNV